MTPENKILNKKNFHKIKAMNYPQMVRFLTNMYEAGFYDAQNNTAGLNHDDMKTVLLSIKGIGEKRAAEIMEALNIKLDEEQQVYYPCGNCGHDLHHVKGAKFCPECAAELTWE